jgi:hypothetical protein
VEAEKSALSVRCAAEQLGRPVLAIGLGGCWGWRGCIGKTTNANGARVDELGPSNDFGLVFWHDRDVIVAFDANAATNVKVQRARRALVVELIKLRAHVRVFDLPAEGGVNGPDDYIGKYGSRAFWELVDAALEPEAFDRATKILAKVAELNRKHAVVTEQGKTLVITEARDPILERSVVTRSSFADFRNQYLNEYLDEGKKRKPVGHVWLTHPHRRQYGGIICAPNQEVPGYLNLWKGFAVEPCAGDWTMFREHIRNVICAGEEALYEYVVAWLGHAVQYPNRLPEVALALRGGRGAGKGMFARTFGELFGQHYLQIANTKHLTGHFNAHLQDAIVLFADEAFWAGDKAGESVLKMLVTEPVIPIARKGQDVIQVKNMLHIIIASNHEWVVPAGMDERRFCVIDVSNERQQDHSYFARLQTEMNTGGKAAMLYDLLNHKITVNLRDVPRTTALEEQKTFSMRPEEKWLLDRLMAGRWSDNDSEWGSCVLKERVYGSYSAALQNARFSRVSMQTELGIFLAKVFPSLTGTRRRLNGILQQFWVFPTLAECRAQFDDYSRMRHDWSEREEESTEG